MVTREPALEAATPSIANEINTATRILHTTLNRLIISRLALALPPNASTPLLYALGIHSFARVFFTFEACWDEVLASRTTLPSQTDEEFLACLSALMSPAIRRTENFQRDIAHLTSNLSATFSSSDSTTKGLLALLSTSNPITPLSHSYMAHIKHTLSQKPHDIIAYAWVMYMALFSGGRHIRAQLRSASTTSENLDFWMRSQDEEAEPLELGFSFLDFEGVHDGEDVKAEFKRQLARLEGFLSPAQRAEIVEEAREVFKRTVVLVGELDGIVGDPVSRDNFGAPLDDGEREKRALVGKAGKSGTSMATREVQDRPSLLGFARWLPLPAIFSVFLCFLALYIM